MEEGTTPEELHKINTMKLLVTFFQRKLDNFVLGKKATDDDLLFLLFHLTDSIHDFVSIAKVIKTNHQIGSVIDKNILSCENIFECLLCSEQTGKTYSSVVNHINTEKHITNAKEFEQQENAQPTTSNSTISTMSPRSLMSPDSEGVIMSDFDDVEINSNMTNEEQEKAQPTTSDSTILTTWPRSLMSLEGVTMSDFLPNNDIEMNSNQTKQEELHPTTTKKTIVTVNPRTLMSPEVVIMSDLSSNNDMETNSNLTNEEQEKAQPTTSDSTVLSTTTRSLMSPEGVTMLDFPPNNVIKTNSNLTNKQQTMPDFSSNNDIKTNSNLSSEEQEKNQPITSYSTISSTITRSLMSLEGVTMLDFPPNNDIKANINLSNEQQKKIPPATSNRTFSTTIRRSLLSPEELTKLNFTANNDIETNSKLKSEAQQKIQPITSNSTISTTISKSLMSTGVTMSHFLPKNDLEINSNLTNETTSDKTDIERPVTPQITFPFLTNHLSNHLQQHQLPLPPLTIARIPIPHGPLMIPTRSNSILPMNPMQSYPFNFCNGSNKPVNGSMNNYNQVPPPQICPDYRGQISQPNNFVGYQQNVVSQNVNPTNDHRRKGQPFQFVVIPSRTQKKIARNANSRSNCERVLSKSAIAFLCENFECEVLEYIREAQILTDEDLYDEIAEQLINGCKELNLQAEVKCFGSRAIGIGWRKADVDLNIIVPDCNLTAKSFLKKLAEVLPEQGCWSSGQYIESQRVSLIRARFARDLNCDITFNNVLAMANTRLTQYFYRIQPECPKLVVFIRKLLQKVDLYPLINSYTINLLVFFYFQNKGYLPKVMDLIETSSLEYWPNEFTQKSLEELKLTKSDTFYKICVGFMDFYSHKVNFENDILSTFTGSTISKRSFGKIRNPEMKAHYKGLLQYLSDNRGIVDGIKQSFKMEMSVQDPFSHDHNVSEHVSKSSMKRFKDLCEDASRVLHQDGSNKNLF